MVVSTNSASAILAPDVNQMNGVPGVTPDEIVAGGVWDAASDLDPTGVTDVINYFSGAGGGI
jgi:hypothetical protein